MAEQVLVALADAGDAVLPGQHAGPFQRPQRLGNCATRATCLLGDALVAGKAAAVPAVVKGPQQRHQDALEGHGDRAVVLPRLTVPDAPGPRVGGNADLGIAVQRHRTARQ